MAGKAQCLIPATNRECQIAMLTLQDTLHVVGGKWKLVLLSILKGGKLDFREITRGRRNITANTIERVEGNGDEWARNTYRMCPVTVESELTPYSDTLSELISVMHAS